MASDMRFTQAQKRDLLRMSGAAVVSTIFFGVPMFIARPDVARVDAVSGYARQVQAAPAAAEPLLRQADPRDVSIVVSDAFAQATVPELERIAPTVGRRAVRTTRQSAAAIRVRPRAQVASASGQPLARRLGRLLAGTGRYEVRPFPTVGTSGS